MDQAPTVTVSLSRACGWAATEVVRKIMNKKANDVRIARSLPKPRVSDLGLLADCSWDSLSGRLKIFFGDVLRGQHSSSRSLGLRHSVEFRRPQQIPVSWIHIE